MPLAGCFTGPSTGQLPNVHWRTLDNDDLRTQPRYHGLPPVTSIDLATPCAYRYVRQEDPLWAAAHRGVLTTGWLKAALGFYEPSTARLLGLPKHFASAGAMRQVYQNLLHDAPHTRAPHPSRLPPVEAANRAAVVQYNKEVTRVEEEGEGHDMLSIENSSRRRSSVHSRKHRHTGRGGGHGPGTGHAPLSAQVEAKHRAQAQALGGAGIGAVRCAWGSAQEPATLAVLLSLLPHCAIHEVGLCLVDATMLQERYGFAVGALPPLGASPDALLQHPPLGGLPCGAGTTWGGGVDGYWGCAGGSWLEGMSAGQSAKQAAAGRTTRRSVQKSDDGDSDDGDSYDGDTRDTSSIPVAESSRASLLQLLQEMDRLDIEEKAAAVLPVLLGQVENEQGPIENEGRQVENKETQEKDNGTQIEDKDYYNTPGIYLPGVLEVVEVKNTCPFTQKTTRRSNGKLRRTYHVEDKGPRDGVLEMWVPQLQMEMLAANTNTALLVTRSATRGVRMFRMARDDGYIGAMLEVLAFLYATYVQRQRCPGPEPYKELRGYVGFLQRTRTLAREAQQVLHDEDAHRYAPGGDMRLLLD